MKKSSKRMLALLLTMAMAVCVVAGCGSSSSTESTTAATAAATEAAAAEAAAEEASDEEVEVEGENGEEVELEHYKIGVATVSTDAYSLLIEDYLKDYIAPNFNVEFIFSEGISSAEEMMTFLENAYAQGCVGIISYSQDSIDQACEKANDLGMYIVTHTTSPGTVNDLEYNLGYLGANTATSGDDFALLVHDLIDGDEEEHGFILLSGGAGQGKANDLQTTVSALETLEDIYDMKFDTDPSELGTARAVTDCPNSAGLTVTIYPGYANTDTYVPGLSSLLQAGDYDIIFCNSTAFAQVATVIDEVEQAFGKNIEIIAKAQVSDAISNSFKTIDSFGNTFLHSAQLTPSCSTAGSLFTILYNGITGHADVVKDSNGECVFYDNPKWLCYNADEYELIELLDVSDDTWELTADDIKEMLYIFNPDITEEEIYQRLKDTGDLQALLVKRGLVD